MFKRTNFQAGSEEANRSIDSSEKVYTERCVIDKVVVDDDVVDDWLSSAVTLEVDI